MKKYFTSFMLTLLLLTNIVSPAQADTETGWRYWGYFQSEPGAKAWTYAQTGPAGANPKDGAVEGWRFSFSSNTVDTGFPALKPNFGGEPIQPTIRRCIVTKAGSNGLEILAKAVPIRTSASGFVCGLNSYPAKECSTEIATPKSLLKK